MIVNGSQTVVCNDLLLLRFFMLWRFLHLSFTEQPKATLTLEPEIA